MQMQMQNLEMELDKPLAQEEVGTSFVKVIRTVRWPVQHVISYVIP